MVTLIKRKCMFVLGTVALLAIATVPGFSGKAAAQPSAAAPAGVGMVGRGPTHMGLRSTENSTITPMLVGTVSDAAGAAIPGARVRAYKYRPPQAPGQHLPRPDQDVTADAQGSFTLQMGNTFSTTLLVDAPGFLPEIDELSRDGSLRQQLSNFRDTPTTITRKITLQVSTAMEGYVADEQGIALSGVTVQAFKNLINPGDYNQEMATVITDGDGAFKFPQVPAQDVMLTFSAPGFAKISKTVSPSEKVAVNMTRGSTVVGKAFFADTRQPAGRTTISLNSEGPRFDADNKSPRPATMHWGEVAYAGDSGTFSFRNVPPGEFSLTIPSEHNFNGRQTQSLQVWNPTNPGRLQLSVSESQPQIGVELPLYNGYAINGTILESGTSNTVAGARVWLMHNWPHQSVLSDDNGRYTFVNIFPNGTPAQLQMTAERSGFSMVTDSRFSGMSTQTLTFTLPTSTTILEANIPLVRQLQFKGRVVDAATSMPLSGAKVAVHSSSYYREAGDNKNISLTDADGRFEIPSTAGQAVRLRVQLNGYANHISDVLRVVPDNDLTIAMGQGASLSGTVFNPANEPAAGAKIYATFSISGATDSSGNSTSYQESLDNEGTSGAGGKFTLTNLPVGGSVIVHAKKTGYAVSDKQTFGVSPGDMIDSVTLQLRVPKHLSGRVLDPSGNPLGDVHIQAHSKNTYGYGVARTGPDGTYKLTDRPDAPVDISLQHPKHGNEWFYNIPVGRDGVDFKYGTGDKDGRQRMQMQATDSNQSTGLTLYGLVVDWQTGEPVKDFDIVGSQYLKFTKDPDLDGVFEGTGFRVANAYQMIRITSPNYAVYDSGPMYIPDGRTELRRTFKLGPGGSITGRAVEKGTGTPVAGVKVDLTEVQAGTGQLPKNAAEKIQPVTTDAEGRFTLTGIGQGHKTLAYEPPAESGFVKMTQPTDVTYNEVTDLGDVEFGTGGTIDGRLIRTPGDTPIPNAQVTLRGQQKPQTTDADGKFQFTNLVNGLYYVEAPQFGSNAWIGVEQLETKELTLEVGTGKLAGTVMRGGTPFSCAVKVQKIGYGQSVARFATADSAGRFTVADLAPGRWKVELTGKAGASFTVSEFIVMPASGESLEKTFTLPSGGLRVTVVDGAGKAVPRAQVIIRMEAAADAVLQSEIVSRETNHAGEAVADGLSAGTFSVSATNDDGERGEKNGITVSNDQTAAVTVALKSALGGNLISTALNMATGKPVPTAWCHLFDEDGHLFEHGKQRDEMGTVMVENIPPGKYRVQVSALGFSISEQQVTIQAGQTSTIDDVLYPSGALRWALRNATGAPAVGIPCTLTPNDAESIEGSRTGSSNSDGVFVVRGLMPGAYTAKANPPGGKNVTASVMIYAANVTDEVAQVE